jgi:hypothetical protein
MLNDLTIDAPVVAVSTKQADAARLEPGTASTQIKKQKSDGDIVGSCAPQSPSMTALVPIMGIVSVAFLVIGFALPSLPLHVHQDLGLSPFVVGLVTGSQFAASLISRVWSGRYADSRGAKRAIVAGLLAAGCVGCCTSYRSASLAHRGDPPQSCSSAGPCSAELRAW